MSNHEPSADRHDNQQHADGIDRQELQELISAQLDDLIGATTSPVNWQAVTAANAPARWAALRGWVGWFRDEFGYDHRVVPPCWYRHPALVNLLQALRDHWASAYDPLNALPAPSEWHRVLAVLEPRLRDLAARTGCTPTEHRPDLHATYPDDGVAFSTHVRADVSARKKREAQQQDQQKKRRSPR